MYRELLPLKPDENSYRDRIDARLNQALSLRALSIKPYSSHKKGDRIFYTADDELSKRAIHRLNAVLRKFYKVRQSDRNLICNQVATLLKESPNLNILKFDLKRFYQSVDGDILLHKIKNDRLLCPYTFELLEQAISPKINIHPFGLPEGICISATLSELYLRNFDRQISQIRGTVYYSRFVDDIIIFSSQDPAWLGREIEQLCKSLKTIMPHKHYSHRSSVDRKIDFDYLGYNFKSKPDEKDVHIEISRKKICRLKTKLMLSVLQFGKDGKLWDFEQRVKLITSNAEVASPKRALPYRSGIYYTYSLCTEREINRQLRKMDNFLVKLLSSKQGKFGNALSGLRRFDRRRLSEFKFTSGFKNRKTWNYSLQELNEFSKPWKYA